MDLQLDRGKIGVAEGIRLEFADEKLELAEWPLKVDLLLHCGVT